jgi:hypothetical protein
MNGRFEKYIKDFPRKIRMEETNGYTSHELKKWIEYRLNLFGSGQGHLVTVKTIKTLN